MNKENCGDCYFYRVNPEKLREGTCCNEPPRVYPIPTPQGMALMGMQPATTADSWCGRYKPKIGHN